MTDLPIDYRRSPWKEKYLFDETFVLNDWMIFGEFEDGTVGISDASNDIFEHVQREIALELIEARNEFTEVIRKWFCDFSE